MNLRTALSANAIAILLLLSVTGNAQDGGRKISVEEAVDLSLKNSKPLKAAHARIDQAVANTTI